MIKPKKGKKLMKKMPMKSIASGQGPALAGPNGAMPMPITAPMTPPKGYRG